MKMGYNLIWELDTQVYAHVNSHLIVHLRFVHVIMYKSYLKKEKNNRLKLTLKMPTICCFQKTYRKK